MDVVPLTLTLSLCLAFTFVLFFWKEHSRRRMPSAESQSLLPLSDEGRLAEKPRVLELNLAGRVPRHVRGCGKRKDGQRCTDCGDHGHP